MGSCGVCGACTRCGCDHDGFSVAFKLSRKRGQRGKRKEPSTAANLSSRSIRARNSSLYYGDRDDDNVEESNLLFKSLRSSSATLRDVKMAFGLSNRDVSNLPPSGLRNDEFQTLTDHTRYKSMVRLVGTLVESLCAVICRGHSKQLLNDVIDDLGKSSDVSHSKRLQSLARNCATSVCALPGISLQRSAVLSCLCSSLSLKQVRQLISSASDGVETVSSNRFALARQHFVSISEGQDLRKPVFSRRKICDSVVTAAVDFILSKRAVRYLSWGTRPIRVDNREFDFPALTRIQVPENLRKTYVEFFPDAKDRVSASLFLRLTNELTSRNSKSKCAVDYCQNKLVSEPCQLLSKMCRGELDSSEQQMMLDAISRVENFLKVGQRSCTLRLVLLIYLFHGVRCIIWSIVCAMILIAHIL